MTTKVSDAMQVTGSETVGLVPVGAGIDYWGTVAPANWAFAYGQALSRTTYAALFAAYGTAYGAGDGSTTFNVPDKRGRASLGKDNMGGTPANRVTNAVSGITATTLGAVGGDQRLHAHNHTTTVNDPGHSHSLPSYSNANSGTQVEDANTSGSPQSAVTGSAATGITVDVVTSGAGTAQNVQPSIVGNYIIRVL